jgi:DNA-binding response OmpR family regulator
MHMAAYEGGPAPCATTGSLAGHRAILIDDDPSLVEAVADALSDEGVEVEAFTEPRSALARLKLPPRPDVVLVDYLMPEMDGGQFVEELARAGIDVPVILISGRERGEVAARALPVALVLQKPVTLESLLAGVAETLRRASRTNA